MSTIASISPLNTMSAPPRAGKLSAVTAPAGEHTDRVDIGSAGPAAEEAPTATIIPTSVKVAAGLGLALAAAGACGAGVSVPQLIAPPPPAQTQVVNLQESVEAIPKLDRELMKNVSARDISDNMTSRSVRNRYSTQVEKALKEADSFQELQQRLEGVGQRLDGYAQQLQDGGSMVDNGQIIGVERDGAQVRVTATGPDGSVQESRRDGSNLTVRERDAQGRTTTLEENGQYVRVTEGNTTRTVYREDGRFEVNTRVGPQRESKMTVLGASIREERVETIHGFAGDVTITHVEAHDVPEIGIYVYPRVELTETRQQVIEDSVSGKTTTRSERIEVYDDGSSKTIRDGMRGQDVIKEPGAILIAGR